MWCAGRLVYHHNDITIRYIPQYKLSHEIDLKFMIEYITVFTGWSHIYNVHLAACMDMYLETPSMLTQLQTYFAAAVFA